MGLPDDIAVAIPETTGRDTALQFKKQEVPAAGSETPLFCCYTAGRDWHQKEFSSAQTRFIVSGDPRMSAIPAGIPSAPGNFLMVVQKCGEKWYLIESSMTDCMTADGIPSHQGVIPPGGKSVVTAGGMTLIFSAAPPRKNLARAGLAVISDTSKFSLNSGNGESQFSSEKPCIIGAGDLCDFHLPGEAYAAIVFCFKKQHFIRPLSSHSGQLFSINGVHSGDGTPIPLPNRSRIQAGNAQIVFSLARGEENKASSNLHFVPEIQQADLRLVSVGPEAAADFLPLPKSGKSVFIGRSPDCELFLDRSGVSRRHAQLITYDRSLLILDCHSTNGTMINGERIGKRMAHLGDIISFSEANYMLCFSE